MAYNLLYRSGFDGVSAMKKIAVLAALLGLLVVPAQASVTTYYWHQYLAYEPGLVFISWYKLVDGTPPVVTNSNYDDPDFGGLIGFYTQAYFQGHWFKPVTLADLVSTSACLPSCSPDTPTYWEVEVGGSNPYLLYVSPGYGYDYVIAGLISYNSFAGPPCDRWRDSCTAEGEWTSDPVVTTPAPASALVLIGSLLAMFALFRAGRDRIRS